MVSWGNSVDGIGILHLEDSALDADLIRVRLEKEGLGPEVTRVDTREDFVSALEEGRYDIVLADYSLPGFDGIAALELARERAPDCPFILVSATLGEEFAVECLRRGATDYIVKQRMERLGPAVRRAILESRERAEKRRNQEELRESERRYRLLAEALPQLVWTALPDGNFDYLSGQWCNYTGISESEQLGLDAFEAIHPEDRADSLEKWRKSVALGRLFEIEHRIRREDGAYRWFQTRAVPLKNAAGVVRWFGTSTDIHDRKLSEEERVEAQRKEQSRSKQVQKLADVASRLNSALDVGSVVGVVTEEARSIIGAHLARTSVVPGGDWARGVHRESLSGKYARWQGRETVVDGSGLAGFACLANRPVRMTEEDLLNHPASASGKDSVLDPPLRGWLSAPLISRSGRNLGLVQLSDRENGEFTEDDEAVLVQLAQMASVAIENARFYHELKDKDQKKDEFLAMLAHELRNPVAGVSNAVTLLKLSNDEENRKWATEVIDRQFRQLARLIDDLLDVSRISSGKIRLKKELIDASPILDHAAESVRSLIEERKHRFETSYPRDGLLLEADQTRLEQVVVNLLTNAAKYTEPGGVIRLDAAVEGASVVIAVEDNGMGISADKLPQMFELFAQGERSIARSEGGLGIGLTVVQKLTEMHGGTIVATSGGVGAGSKFVVRLPSARPAVSATENGKSETAVVTGLEGEAVLAKGAKILVVDDNVDTAAMMSRLLVLLGHDVRVAFDGMSALDVAVAFAPRFILLDIGLPGMDGFTVASKLRKDRRFDRSVIVAVSGYGQEEDRKRSREAGFDHHLVKPVDHDVLLSILTTEPSDRMKVH